MSLTTSKCEINFEKVKCSAAKTISTVIITLTTASTDLPHILNAGEWILTLW